MKIRRSALLETGARTMVPTIVVVAGFLLVVGHDQPGGGFVAGLLAGVALLVVFLTGGREAVAATLPVAGPTLAGAGIAVATASALGGLVLGSALLDAAKLNIDAGPIGDFSVSTALVFDLGVVLVVVGLVKTILVHLGDPEEGRP